MSAHLQTEFNKLEQQRKSIFALLKNVEDDMLNKTPAQGDWSVATIVRHLILAEEMSLQYLRKKTQDTSLAAKTGFRHSVKMLQVKAVFAFNIKFKAPQVVNPEIKTERKADLEAEWNRVRQETYRLLEKLPADDLNKEIWKHAIAGKLNAFQMLQFFGMHTNRHTTQIKNALRKLSA